jgi:hypothetical protein
MIVANHAFLSFCLVYMEIGTCKSSYVLKVYNNHLLTKTCFVFNFSKPNVVLEGDLTLQKLANLGHFFHDKSFE